MSNSISDEELENINIRYLVPIIRKLIGIIGIADAMKLLVARGGTPLWVSKNPDDAHGLLAIFPRETVAKLCAELPTGWIEIPKADKVIKQVRDYYIQAGKKEMTYPELAIRFQLTRRRVISICKKPKEEVMRPIIVKVKDDRQVDLFPED